MKWAIFSCSLVIVVIMIILHLSGDAITLIDDWFYSIIPEIRGVMLKYFEFMTYLADPKLMFIVCGLSLITLFSKKKYALYLVGIMILTTCINQALKYLLQVPRPEYAILYKDAPGYSFPSGHTMGCVSFYGFIIWLIINSSLNKTVKWIVSLILLFLIINISFSRIYIGVHYFSDVLAGVLISIAILIISTSLILKYGKDVI